MITCTSCERHIRIDAKPCPFCGAAPSRTVLAAVLSLALAACGPALDGEMTGSDDTTAGTGTTMPGTTATPTTTGSPMTSSSTTLDPDTTSTGLDTGSSTANDDDVDDTACGFYGCPGDLGPPMPIQCDVVAQDCPEDEKCMPWADDGGNSWNATRCSPVAADPDAVGEDCRVEGSGVSGIDSCVLGAMCWDVDVDTDEGTCVAMCEPSADGPVCTIPGTVCSISNEEVLQLCLPSCDPKAPDCPEGMGCLPASDDVFVCAPDGS